MAISNNGQMNKTIKTLHHKLAHLDYARLALIAALVVGVVGGSYAGYRWYSVRREQAAQKVFADCMQEYASAQAGQVTWTAVEELCKRAYEKTSRTHIAPYVLALQTDALMSQHKNGEALAVLATVLDTLSKKSPLYSTYALKHALISLDMADEAVQQEGFKELRELALNQNNSQRDEALYYLGLYHWSRNEIATAQELWQELVDLAKKDESGFSAWAGLAQEKLQPLK